MSILKDHDTWDVRMSGGGGPQRHRDDGLENWLWILVEKEIMGGWFRILDSDYRQVPKSEVNVYVCRGGRGKVLDGSSGNARD